MNNCTDLEHNLVANYFIIKHFYLLKYYEDNLMNCTGVMGYSIVAKTTENNLFDILTLGLLVTIFAVC